MKYDTKIIKAYIKAFSNSDSFKTIPGENYMFSNRLRYNENARNVSDTNGIIYRVSLKYAVRKVNGFYAVTSVNLSEVH